MVGNVVEAQLVCGRDQIHESEGITLKNSMFKRGALIILALTLGAVVIWLVVTLLVQNTD